MGFLVLRSLPSLPAGRLAFLKANRMMRQHVFAAAAILSLAVASLAHAEPTTNVVFGNLGTTGTNALSPGLSVGISPSLSVAHGFTVTGSSSLVLQKVTLGLADNDSTTAQVAIHLDDGTGQPGFTAIETRSAAVSSNTPNLQTFDFGNLNLTNGSSYWVVVSAPDIGSLFNWALNNAFLPPTAQNGSDWTYTSTKSLAGFSWSDGSSYSTASISVQAVPEPTTYAMAAAGIVAAGLARWRRRLCRGGR